MKTLCGWVVIAAILCACGPSHLPVAAATASSSPSAVASPTYAPTPSVSPAQSAASAPRLSPTPSIDCSQKRAAPTSAPSAPSTRSLALISTDAYATDFQVRDVTDINQTFTVSNLTHQVSPDARFVNGTELSDVQYGIGLVRLPLSGSATTVVAACGNKPFVWSPDGMSAAYIAPTSDPTVQALHVVAGGVDEVAERMPAIPGGFGCESRGQGCDSWTNSILYSQNGAYISFMQQFTRFSVFRIWTSSGSVLKSLDSSKATMQIWSANTLYWQDDTGIRSWRDGTESLAFPGMHWMEPRGSTAGGQIVYQTLDSGLVAHVHVLDLHDGQSLEIASFRSAPAFLTSRYLWYVGDKCSAPCGNPEHGGGFLYDLQTGTESSSSITWLWDAWPHPA